MDHSVFDSSECKLTEYKLPELIMENVFDSRLHVWLSKVGGCYRLTRVC